MVALIIISTVLVVVITVFIGWAIKREVIDSQRIILDGSEHVLITGCDSGIGFAVAKHLQEQKRKGPGFQVIATCIRPDGSAAQELKSLGVIVLSLDFIKDDVKTFCKYVDTLVGAQKLHAIVNNAGVLIMGEFDWLTEAQIETSFKVNLSAMVILKGMMSRIVRDRTRFINVSSVNGQITFPGLSIYCATKHALEAFTDAVGMELARFAVPVIKFRLGAFAGITGILSGQRRHADAMWQAFTSEQRARYGSYFSDYHRVIEQQCGMCSVTHFLDLFRCFEHALHAVHPHTVYTAGALVIPLSILSLFPDRVRNALVSWAFKRGLRKEAVKYPSKTNEKLPTIGE